MSSIKKAPWRIQKEKIVFEHPVIRLKSSLRSREDGKIHEFVLLEAAPWVNVVATTPDDQVVLIEQWRHGTGQTTLEIPGGLVDPGEEPMAAGARELLEETGYAAPGLIPLGRVDANPALFNNQVYTYWAKDAVKRQEASPEDTEDIEVLLTPRKDLPSLVSNGRITHSLVVAALSLFWLKTAAVSS